MENKKQFFIKLNPPRSSFAEDLTDEEKVIMQQHAQYWGERQSKGQVIVYGPVFDPKGVFGVGIVEFEDESLLADFEKNDPALKAGNTYEVYPMMAFAKS